MLKMTSEYIHPIPTLWCWVCNSPPACRVIHIIDTDTRLEINLAVCHDCAIRINTPEKAMAYI